ncbi:hypothetical protein SteCoe_27352 [Stentor coeruleus]|uniref:Uncharacterized protein n=1 Tax=Stentor coeruleus TaxID=5963 RepID=A0A1R2BB91_9CILI|nr:hypothetical protein SteCoe_27352 [Stentor coeruleus]
MMDTFHLSVVKIEGIYDVSNSYCYIYLGSNILRVLTLECFDVQPIPIVKGILRFVIEDSHNSKVLASLSFASSIFKRIGYHWMPLFKENEQYLTEVPEEVSLPRILFDVHANILSPVQELTEESETAEEASDDMLDDLPHLKIKLMNMSIKISELEENLLTQKRIFDEEVEFVYVKNLEKIRLYEDKTRKLEENLKKSEEYCAWLVLEVEKGKEIVEDERKKKEIIENDTLKTVEIVKTRENSILAMLQQKDLEIFALNTKLRKSQEFGVSIEGGIECQSFKKKLGKKLEICNEIGFEVLRIRELTENKQENQNLGGKVLINRFEDMKISLGISKTDNLCAYNTGKNNGKAEESWQAVNIIIKEKEALSRKLFETESKISAFKLGTLEEIDNKVRKFLSKHKIDNFATICNELVYNIASKKVNVFLKNDVIYCKTGGGIKKFDYFIKSYCSQDIENFKKKQSNNVGESSHKRFYTSIEIDKISNSFAHKTFDNSIRAKSSKQKPKNSMSPTRRKDFSPTEMRKITTR